MSEDFSLADRYIEENYFYTYLNKDQMRKVNKYIHDEYGVNEISPEILMDMISTLLELEGY